MNNKQAVIARLRRKPIRIDVHTHVGIDAAGYGNESYPYALSLEDLILRLDRAGIDCAVAFPFAATRTLAMRGGRIRRVGKSVPFRYENAAWFHEVYEAFPQYADRIIPFAFFDPGRAQKEQAAFLKDLAARYPLFGLKTASSYVHSYVSDLLRGGHPLLDLAACLDIPVLLHCSILSGDPWANVFDQCLQVARSRPDVRFALAHTCRFDRRALEAADALPNCFVDFSAFHIHARFAQQNSPVVAKKRFRFPADYRDHAGAMAKIAEAYPNTMLWGTDTPYHYCIGRWVDANGKTWLLRLSCDPDIEGRELRKLPSSLIRRITYTNTLRFLFGG